MNPITSERVVEILQDSIKVLQTHGWCQGQYYKDGQYCIIGAIHAVISGSPIPALENSEYRERSAVFQYLPHRLSEWNDATGRTVDEVIQTLQDAIEKVQ